MKTAFITGITGQDGAYLAQLLLSKGYKVVGGHRRNAHPATWRLKKLGILRDVELIPCEMLEYSNIHTVIDRILPDEVYNLAAQCSLTLSFDMPDYTSNADGLGAMRLLEAIKLINPHIKFFQASSSEMFGRATESPQNENTPFHPRNPYGNAKLFSHWATVIYRDTYGIHASSGILFNHDSPLRDPEFVTKKITAGVVALSRGDLDCLELGSLNARRDWGFAGDYVDAMWRMLQQPTGDTYVVATGSTTSVRSFVEIAAEMVGIKIDWRGTGPDEIGISKATGKKIIRINQKFYRPAEATLLQGDASKAKEILGWTPTVSFTQLVSQMVSQELSDAS